MFADRTNWDLTANRLGKALAAHKASGKQLLDLTASNPTECGFAYDQEKILSALSNPAALGYEPNARGMEVARQAVAACYGERGVRVSAENIILTTSTSEAYSFAFRTLCNPSDEVLIPEPSYPLFDFLADIQDVRLVRYPLVYDHGWQIHLDALERAITERTRAVIVVNPNNPTGSFVKRGEVEVLNRICSAREMAIIADEVFLDFSLEDRTKASFAGNTGALSLTMSGLSKVCGLPQMKMAWLVASGPDPLKQDAMARLEVIADTYLSVSAPVQLATPAFLAGGRNFRAQVQARVKRNLAELDRQLALQEACERLKVEGGWYAALRVPATRSDEDLAIGLLDSHGVYVHPGHFYDFTGNGFLIVSLITSEQVFADGVGRILSMF
ncbi:MAG TPA: pyridoxal phosphate-dependent aminotransferase [Candidatus Acidoferrum sp.]|jgi:aspartate/methionine/tyrosine aminotransferase